MKIDNLLQSLQGKGKTAKKKGADFQAVLATELAGQTRVEKNSGPAKTSRVSTIAPELRIEGLGLTESTINTLDSFSAALANRALKIEELEPYVSALEEEVTALLAVKEEMPQDDPLAQLLDRVATVSYLETAKYRRGDYA